MNVPSMLFTDISLTFGIFAMVFLVIAQIASPYCGIINLTLNVKKLKNMGIVSGLIFIITFTIQIINSQALF